MLRDRKEESFCFKQSEKIKYEYCPVNMNSLALTCV